MISRSTALMPWRLSISTKRALQHLPPAQIIVDQEAPFLDHVLGRLGKAIAGHVDQPEQQRIADVEEVQFLRPPRRVRCARQAVAIGQRVEQRRLADIRPPGKGDLRHVGSGRCCERRRRFQERDRPGEHLARRSSASIHSSRRRARAHCGRRPRPLPSAAFSAGCLRIEPLLLRDRQQVRRDPVELQPGRERRHHEHHDPRHDREHLLLHRVHRRRVQLELQPHA